MTPERLARVALATTRAGGPYEATNLLVGTLDEWLCEGAFANVADVLDALDPALFDAQTMTGVLTLTWHARDQLKPAWLSFFARVIASLPVEQRARLEARLDARRQH